jgi:hypothetical protein
MNFTFLPSSRVLIHSSSVIFASLAGISGLDFSLAQIVRFSGPSRNEFAAGPAIPQRRRDEVGVE